MVASASKKAPSYWCKSALIVIQRRSTEDQAEDNTQRHGSTDTLFSAVRWRGEHWDAEVFVPTLPASRSNVVASVAPLRISLAGSPNTDLDAHADAPTPDATVELLLDVGHVEVDIASTTPVHLFWTSDEAALYISTDLRWLPNVVTSGVDPAGVYALLKCRSLLPPFTIWRRARRFSPATRTCFDISKQEVVGYARSQFAWPRLRERSGSSNSSVLHELDSYLERTITGRRPVLFLSGGVDSSLLAWRLQTIGRKDAVFLHFTHGPNHPETNRARNIAKELQIELVEVQPDLGYAFDFLAGIGERLPYPVESMSLIERALLCDRVADFGPDAVAICGTGADGLFGMHTTASHIASVQRSPLWSRRLARRLFDLYLWKHAATLPAKVAALAKRSAFAVPPAALAIANDQFEDIFYYCDAEERDAVSAEMQRLCERVTSDSDPLLLQCRLLDLMAVCAANYAQVTSVHFASRDDEAVFPFLDRHVIGKIMPEQELSSKEREEKSELKRLLATRVSPDLVYAKKYPFQHDLYRNVRDPNIFDLIDNAISTCPRDLRIHLNCERVRAIFHSVRKGRSVPSAHFRVAWNSAVVILWHSQMVKAGDAVKSGTIGRF